MTPTLSLAMDSRSGAALEAARMAFLVRPEDINLGHVFNAMRLRQREIEWRRMQSYEFMFSQQAQHSNIHQYQNMYQGSFGLMAGVMKGVMG